MAAELVIEIAGEPMHLLGDRALYWPARKRLLIADLHLGKGDVFRRAGIALPRGGTLHDLARLSALLAQTGAQSLWMLGDVLHGPTPQADWRRQVAQWRSAHAHVHMAALAGNHDRALSAATDLGLERLPDCVDDGPFQLRHDPAPQAERHVLCGHLHPVFKAPGTARRFPAFLLSKHMTVLPAFSHFTAGMEPQLMTGERLVACVEGEAIELPLAT